VHKYGLKPYASWLKSLIESVLNSVLNSTRVFLSRFVLTVSFQHSINAPATGAEERDKRVYEAGPTRFQHSAFHKLFSQFRRFSPGLDMVFEAV
jgi:hypothetical protein